MYKAESANKKPWYKRWKVWGGTFAALIIIGAFVPEPAEVVPEVAPKKVEAVAVKSPEEISKDEEAAKRIAEISKANEAKAAEAAKVTKPAQVERDAEIRKAAEGFIEKYLGSEIVKIDVNENLGANDGSYLVLAHMSFPRPNSVKKSRELVKMYSEDLAANLAKESDVSDVIVFWEVPRFLEGRNAAKFTYKRAGSGMALADEFIAPELK